MAVADPILLPSFTLAGYEISALMLPASPEISQLRQDFAAALRRLTERPDAIITFVDPVTGQLALPAAAQPADTWLLVDPAPDETTAATVTRIAWDNPPA